VIRRWATVLWWLAMTAGTIVALLPVRYLTLPVFSLWDKLQHAGGFAVLSFWALLIWSTRMSRVVLWMLIYGGALELAQAWTGWRYGEWADWAADAAGVALAFLLFVVLKRSAFRR